MFQNVALSFDTKLKAMPAARISVLLVDLVISYILYANYCIWSGFGSDLLAPAAIAYLFFQRSQKVSDLIALTYTSVRQELFH